MPKLRERALGVGVWGWRGCGVVGVLITTLIDGHSGLVSGPVSVQRMHCWCNVRKRHNNNGRHNHRNE